MNIEHVFKNLISFANRKRIIIRMNNEKLISNESLKKLRTINLRINFYVKQKTSGKTPNQKSFLMIKALCLILYSRCYFCCITCPNRNCEMKLHCEVNKNLKKKMVALQLKLHYVDFVLLLPRYYNQACYCQDIEVATLRL